MVVQYIKYPDDFADDNVIINSFRLCTLEKILRARMELESSKLNELLYFD